MKFSAKARGKQPAELNKSPHSLKAIGKYDMEIGPHVFHDTAFFEVLYHSASTEYSSSQDKSSMCFEHSFSEASSTSSLSCQPLFSAGSPEASVEVTPALISQVNQAAAANPAIQNLLQLAAFFTFALLSLCYLLE